MPTLSSTLLSVALAAVLTLAAYTDTVFVALAVFVVQLMIATGPPATNERGRRIPTPRFVPVAVGGIVAVFITLNSRLLAGAGGTSAGVIGFVASGVFAGLAIGMTVSFFLAVFAQMARKDGRAHLVLSLSYVLLLAIFAGLSIGWIGASQSLAAERLVAVAAAAASVALLVWLIPGPRWPLGAVGVVLAGVAGGVVAAQLDVPAHMATMLALALFVGLFAILGEVIARILIESGAHQGARWGFAGVLPIAVVAPVVFVGSQILTM